MNYRQLLDEAIGESPRTTIDLDQRIGRQRRLRRVRTAAIGTAAAVVLAVGVGAASLGGVPRAADPAPPAATGSPVPAITTVPGTTEDRARIDAAIFAALAREVPDLKWTRNATEPASPVQGWSAQGGEQTTANGYWGQGGIWVGDHKGTLSVQLERDGMQMWVRLGNCPAKPTTGQTCTTSTGPAGERIRVRWSVREYEMTPRSGGTVRLRRESRSVEVLRPDGTFLEVKVHGGGTGQQLPLTENQMVAVALDPAIALAPVPTGG